MTPFREPSPPLAGSSFDTPLGPLAAVVDASGALVALEFADSRPLSVRGHAVAADGPATAPVKRQLDEYFASERREFDLALAPFGTAFQRAVWAALLAIPYGATISYLELARRIGNPSATRAVGRTNGLNPITIVVPCHRVIGADGTLTGYGGGLPRKEALLALEGARTLSQGRLPLAAR